MNLNDITTKPYILALIIRDDGERLLLGDGTYDFKDTLQHFQTDTFANDVVELQGADGQLLAGQVRRAGTQKFIGYIGDASMSKQKIEELRRAFLMFFRKKHFYKVVYIFCDGSAIQRKRGYIVNPPTAPEMWQKFPEYSISINFEDVNYYEYEEDEFGDEIYAHIVQIALAKALEGGLVWDAIGAVSDDITWSNILSASGEYISIDNTLDRMAPLASIQIDGNATQSGTPTPDDPIPVQVVTGENVVKIEGKNLAWTGWAQDFVNRINNTGMAKLETFDGKNCAWWKENTGYGSYDTKYLFKTNFKENTQYTVTFDIYPSDQFTLMAFVYTDGTATNFGSGLTANTWYHGAVTSASGKTIKYIRVNYNAGNVYLDLDTFQIELGSTATTYEPYQAQSYEVNLGKNLFDNSQASVYNSNATAETISTGIRIKATTTGANSFCGFKLFRSSDYLNKSITLSANISPSALNTPRAYIGLCDANGGNRVAKVILTGTGNQSVTYTHTEEVATSPYIMVALYSNSGGAAQIGDYVDFTDLQLEASTSASSYAPYFTPIELAKIGTYQDYIWKDGDDWKVHKAVRHLSLPIASMDNTDSYPGWKNVDHIRTDLGTGLNTQLYAVTPRMDNIDDGTKNFGINTNASNATIFTYNGAAGVFGAKTQTQIIADYPNLVMELYYGILEANQYDEAITKQTLIDQLDALGNAKLYVGQNNISTTTLTATPTLELEYYGAYTEEGAGYEWEPGGGSQNIITVNGIDNARPIWQVVGPANNPTLTNITTGQTISWQGFVPIGQTLTIDMNEMTADLAGANVFEYITGTWIELRPGNNTLVYTADGGAEADSTLSWNGVAS